MLMPEHDMFCMMLYTADGDKSFDKLASELVALTQDAILYVVALAMLMTTRNTNNHMPTFILLWHRNVYIFKLGVYKMW
jgi:hypothetical protein